MGASLTPTRRRTRHLNSLNQIVTVNSDRVYGRRTRVQPSLSAITSSAATLAVTTPDAHQVRYSVTARCFRGEPDVFARNFVRSTSRAPPRCARCADQIRHATADGRSGSASGRQVEDPYRAARKTSRRASRTRPRAAVRWRPSRPHSSLSSVLLLSGVGARRGRVLHSSAFRSNRSMVCYVPVVARYRRQQVWSRWHGTLEDLGRAIGRAESGITAWTGKADIDISLDEKEARARRSTSRKPTYCTYLPKMYDAYNVSESLLASGSMLPVSRCF